MNIDPKKIAATTAAIAKGAKNLSEDDDFRKLMFGTYNDGSARNLYDAMNGEFESPSEKKSHKDKTLKKKDKKKKKGKKKNKKKSKNNYKL